MPNPKSINTEGIRNNPCHKEHLMSHECLNKNNYDPDKCKLYFDNYNACKRFWGKVTLHRRSKGIEPSLPELEDRDRVKAEFLAQQKSNRAI